MDFKEVIYSRRSERDFKEQLVEKELVEQLIDAGIHAPSAKNQQPWAFTVMQDKKMLKQLSDDAKAYFLSTLDDGPVGDRYRGVLENPNFNIFYNTGTLLTIFSRPEPPTLDGPIPEYDCCLAAENIILAAHNLGLGTCWIGFAMPYLNSTMAREKFGIAEGYVCVAPLVVGYPMKPNQYMQRTAPEILYWK